MLTRFTFKFRRKFNLNYFSELLVLIHSGNPFNMNNWYSISEWYSVLEIISFSQLGVWLSNLMFYTYLFQQLKTAIFVWKIVRKVLFTSTVQELYVGKIGASF